MATQCNYSCSKHCSWYSATMPRTLLWHTRAQNGVRVPRTFLQLKSWSSHVVMTSKNANTLKIPCKFAATLSGHRWESPHSNSKVIKIIYFINIKGNPVTLLSFNLIKLPIPPNRLLFAHKICDKHLSNSYNPGKIKLNERKSVCCPWIKVPRTFVPQDLWKLFPDKTPWYIVHFLAIQSKGSNGKKDDRN